MEWVNYYKTEFVKKLQYFKQINNTQNCNKKDFCYLYTDLFFSACKLIELYFCYNGLFIYDRRRIVREAFYYELINEGEKWINACFLSETYEDTKDEQFYPLFLSCSSQENFVIFEDLNRTFIKLLEEYE